MIGWRKLGVWAFLGAASWTLIYLLILLALDVYR